MPKLYSRLISYGRVESKFSDRDGCVPSLNATEPRPGYAQMSVLRGALHGFTKLFADKYAAQNVRMNNVMPGYCENVAMTAGALKSIPMGRTARFGEILTDVVRERGVGILLVEHDMALVNDVCDRVYVLEFGHLIFSGTPMEVAASSIVQAAYLGDVELGREVPVPEETGR